MRFRIGVPLSDVPTAACGGTWPDHIRVSRSISARVRPAASMIPTSSCEPDSIVRSTLPGPTGPESSVRSVPRVASGLASGVESIVRSAPPAGDPTGSEVESIVRSRPPTVLPVPCRGASGVESSVRATPLSAGGASTEDTIVGEPGDRGAASAGGAGSGSGNELIVCPMPPWLGGAPLPERGESCDGKTPESIVAAIR